MSPLPTVDVHGSFSVGCVWTAGRTFALFQCRRARCTAEHADTSKISRTRRHRTSDDFDWPCITVACSSPFCRVPARLLHCKLRIDHHVFKCFKIGHLTQRSEICSRRHQSKAMIHGRSPSMQRRSRPCIQYSSQNGEYWKETKNG